MIRGMSVHSLAQKMKTLIPPQNRKQFTQSMYWTNYSKHKVQPEKPIFQEEFSLYFLQNNYNFFSVFKVIKSLIQTFSPKRTYFELKTIPGRHRERERSTIPFPKSMGPGGFYNSVFQILERNIEFYIPYVKNHPGTW